MSFYLYCKEFLIIVDENVGKFDFDGKFYQLSYFQSKQIYEEWRMVLIWLDSISDAQLRNNETISRLRSRDFFIKYKIRACNACDL